jgi:hypothetical protein
VQNLVADLAARGTITAIQKQSYVYAADIGSANAYAVTLSPAPTITAGSIVVVKIANANTGASTLAVNGGTATPIKKQGTTALASGDLSAGQIAAFVSDGTNWQWLGSSGGGGGSTLYFGQDHATASTGNNVIRLGSTPVTNSVSVFVDGTLRSPSAYSLIGTVETLATPLTSGNLVDVNWATLNSTPGGITLSTAGICGSFAYCEAIVVDHTKMGSTDEAGFPVLVTGSANTEMVASGGKATSSAGFDVNFYPTNACSGTKLAWETEAYSGSSTASIYWILPTVTISHTTDTIIGYRCIGNSGVTTDQSNASGTWPSSYKGVWHMPNGTSLTLLDSTSNAHNGTNNNAVTATTGKIDGAGNFNGTNQYVDLGSGLALGTGLNISGNLTYEAWVKPAAVGILDAILSGGAGGPELIQHSGNFFYFQASSGGTPPGPTITAGTWYRLVATVSGSTFTVYQNGAMTTTASGANSGTVANVNIGQRGGGGINWPGVIDEVRISNVARSADWVLAEYNNESSPSTFYSLVPQ